MSDQIESLNVNLKEKEEALIELKMNNKQLEKDVLLLESKYSDANSQLTNKIDL